MTIDQNATAGATTTGSTATGHAEDAGQVAGGGILTAKAGAQAPEAAAKTTDTPLADGGAAELPGWMAALTADQRADAALTKELAQKFPKGATQLVQAYVESKGRTVPAVPNDKATPEEWATYRKSIGVPEKPDGYKLERGKAPKGLEYPEAMTESLRKVAHLANLTQDQAQKVHLWAQIARLEDLKGAAQTVRQTIQETTDQLKTTWGGSFDVEMANMERGAQVAFQKFPGLADKFSRSGLANDVETIQLFAWLGKMVSPGRMISGSPATGAEQKSLAERIYGTPTKQ